MKRQIAASLLMSAGLNVTFADTYRVVVTIENLAPNAGTFQTPHWVGFHGGKFDIYDGGTPADNDPVSGDPLRSVERLAEDGNTGPLSETFAQLVPSGVDATIPGPNGALAPGEITRAVLTLESHNPAQRYFSYASMVLPSNDFWYANGNPLAHPIFDDGGNFIAEGFIVNQDGVLDAGTEVGDEIPANTAFFGQQAPDTGVAENGVIRDFRDDQGNPQLSFLEPGEGAILDDPRFSMADFALPGYPLVKISFGAAPAVSDKLRFRALLSGDQEVPQVDTKNSGRGSYRLRKEGTRLRFRHRLSIPEEEIVAAHLHLGAKGEIGPIVAFLFDESNRAERVDTSGKGARPTRIRGALETADLIGPLQGQPLDRLIAEIQAGNVYVNIHTPAYPDGELRGQLDLQASK